MSTFDQLLLLACSCWQTGPALAMLASVVTAFAAQSLRQCCGTPLWQLQVFATHRVQGSLCCNRHLADWLLFGQRGVGPLEGRLRACMEAYGSTKNAVHLHCFVDLTMQTSCVHAPRPHHSAACLWGRKCQQPPLPQSGTWRAAGKLHAALSCTARFKADSVVLMAASARL